MNVFIYGHKQEQKRFQDHLVKVLLKCTHTFDVSQEMIDCSFDFFKGLILEIGTLKRNDHGQSFLLLLMLVYTNLSAGRERRGDRGGRRERRESKKKRGEEREEREEREKEGEERQMEPS